MTSKHRKSCFFVGRSLTAKIFLITMGLLVLIGLLACLLISAFLPVTYENKLEENLQKSAEELVSELEGYEHYYDVENVLRLFAAANEAQVILLDSQGWIYYWEGGSQDDTAQETVVAYVEDSVTEEDTDGSWEEAADFPLELQEQSGIKYYEVQIGEDACRLYVIGTMQAVNQTMEILRQIFPLILGAILLVSFLCGLGASVYLTRPIITLSRISGKMAKLDFGETCREGRKDEIGLLALSLNELSQNLNKALAELRETNAKLRSFFAAASHELKTPVTILKGHLGGMCQNLETYRDRDEYLKRSYEVTVTLEGMIGEILAVSRMESGAWEAHMEETDLAELARLQAAELWELMEQKSMELAAQLPEHLFWRADKEMLIKVFRNLLMNAIRYSPEGAHIRLMLWEKDENVCFQIENTGVHLPKESVSHLFEPFYRVEGSRNRESGGSGLGLYIVKMILEFHHGVFGAENSRDGVRVWFRIPKLRSIE